MDDGAGEEQPVDRMMMQLCLDISSAAMAVFDGLDSDGVEAPWVKDVGGPVTLNLLALRRKTDALCNYFAVQAKHRLIALDLAAVKETSL